MRPWWAEVYDRRPPHPWIPELDYQILERTRARRLLTVAEAAHLLGIPRGTVNARIARGAIPALRGPDARGRGARAYYLAAETVRWLQTHRLRARGDFAHRATDRYHRRAEIAQKLAGKKG